MAETKGKMVLGFSGSPRRMGNTEVLLDEVLRGAKDAGATTEKLILADMDIAPCDACMACKESGECSIADDMEDILEKMGESEVWVLGTPVYFWGPSAQFKLFVDRWYSKSHRAEDKAMFRGRRVILAMPMGESDTAEARHAVGMLSDALKYMGAGVFATVLAPDVHEPGEVRSRSEVMKAAYEAGRNAISGGGRHA